VRKCIWMLKTITERKVENKFKSSQQSNPCHCRGKLFPCAFHCISLWQNLISSAHKEPSTIFGTGAAIWSRMHSSKHFCLFKMHPGSRVLRGCSASPVILPRSTKACQGRQLCCFLSKIPWWEMEMWDVALWFNSQFFRRQSLGRSLRTFSHAVVVKRHNSMRNCLACQGELFETISLISKKIICMLLTSLFTRLAFFGLSESAHAIKIFVYCSNFLPRMLV
jgi:hypothetical protein